MHIQVKFTVSLLWKTVFLEIKWWDRLWNWKTAALLQVFLLENWYFHEYLIFKNLDKMIAILVGMLALKQKWCSFSFERKRNFFSHQWKLLFITLISTFVLFKSHVKLMVKFQRWCFPSLLLLLFATSSLLKALYTHSLFRGQMCCRNFSKTCCQMVLYGWSSELKWPKL